MEQILDWIIEYNHMVDLLGIKINLLMDQYNIGQDYLDFADFAGIYSWRFINFLKD